MDLLKIQLAYFFSNPLEDPVKISSELREDMASVMKFAPLYTNVPSDAPKEIPRVILRGEGVDINISAIRLDIFWNGREVDSELIPKIDLFVDAHEIKIIRIGYVRTFSIDKNLSEVKWVLSDSYQDELSGRGQLESLRLRVNTQNELPGLGIRFNNAENFVEERTEADGEKKIIVERDLNTLQEEQQEISASDRGQIIGMFRDESKNSLIYEGEEPQ